MGEPSVEREAMVARQIAKRGLRDPALLAAMRAVPREEFVPPSWRELAYHDAPLPIGEGQTISQPFIVALMIDALDLHPGDRILEIGAGSGYAMAVLAHLLAGSDGAVFGVERLPELAEATSERLARMGYTCAHLHLGDGTLGWPEHAPYDGILVSAGSPDVPPALIEQLAVGGRMVIPVGPQHDQQRLLRITRRAPDASESRGSAAKELVTSPREEADETLVTEDLGAVRFVSLIGAEGWDPAADDRRRRWPRRWW